VLRLLLLLVAFGAAAIWIDWDLDREQRSLTLRLRSTEELVESVRDRSRDLGRRVVTGTRERLAPVGAEPPAGEPSSSAGPAVAQRTAPVPPGEHITPQEQERLDRVIAETTRGQ
jgi:hypothetical protein